MVLFCMAILSYYEKMNWDECLKKHIRIGHAWFNKTKRKILR